MVQHPEKQALLFFETFCSGDVLANISSRASKHSRLISRGIGIPQIQQGLVSENELVELRHDIEAARNDGIRAGFDTRRPGLLIPVPGRRGTADLRLSRWFSAPIRS